MGRRPQHIKAARESIADKAVIVGDPARAEFLASEFLEESSLVNENRGFLVYTGWYKGERVTVAVHGVGGPSAAIVIEELSMLGAKVMVRLGTCGGLIEELDIGDMVVASGAACNPGGIMAQYFPGICPPLAPDPGVTLSLYNNARARGRAFLGAVYSSDAFYAEDPSFARRMSSMGIIAVEMEAATLFALSLLRGFKSGALLVVSDNLVVPGKEELLGHEELKEYMYKAAEAALEALREN